MRWGGGGAQVGERASGRGRPATSRPLVAGGVSAHLEQAWARDGRDAKLWRVMAMEV